MNLRTVLPCLCLAAATATAQESRGPFTGLPAGLGIATNPALTLAPDGVLAKAEGYVAAVQPASPTHDLAAILAFHSIVGVDVDDFSTGLDWIEVDDNTGRLDVPPNQWAGMTFSVTPGTAGLPGSRIAAEAARPAGAKGALFSYVFRGSMLPAPLVDAVERAHDHAELGLPAGADLDGVDQLMPMWQLDQPVRNMLPPTREIYFTVDAATTGPMPWPSGVVQSGATIWVTRERPGAFWSAPTIWMHPTEVGLQDTDDIDALAIDLNNQRILLSTTNPALNPLLFVYYGTDFAAAVPLENPDGTQVKDAIGLVGSDDVDAICAMDPSVRARSAPHGSGPNPFHWFCATPRAPQPQPHPALHGSACRGWDGANVIVHSWLSGWPPSGPNNGLAALLLTFEDNLAPLFQLSPLFVRDPTPVLTGDPRRWSVAIPPAIGFATMNITLRWVATDGMTPAIYQAFPAKVHL